MRRNRRALAVILIVLSLTGLAVCVVADLLRFGKGDELFVPTVQVKKGSLDLKVYTSGDLRAARSVQLFAPPAGAMLQIVHLTPTGTVVQKGDLVIEFDPSEQEYSLEQARSRLDESDQEIIKIKADAAVQAAQDQVAVIKARFAVRRAELEVNRNELVSAIDAKKNLLNLEEARRSLDQLEHNAESKADSNRAGLTVAEEKRNKAHMEMLQAKALIDNMRIRAPISGLVAVKENYDIFGGVMFGGAGSIYPDYRPGDQVGGGRLVAEIHAVDQMEVQAKISENERANLYPGQPAQISIDASPGRSYDAKLKSVAGLSSRRLFELEAMRQFDVTLELSRTGRSIRPGVTAQVVIQEAPLTDVVYVPRQAVFDRDGVPMVFVKKGNAFEETVIKIVRRNESYAVIEGLSEGTEVAMTNPDETRRSRQFQRALAPPVPGGSH